jgi:hypothetical protein
VADERLDDEDMWMEGDNYWEELLQLSSQDDGVCFDAFCSVSRVLAIC